MTRQPGMSGLNSDLLPLLAQPPQGGFYFLRILHHFETKETTKPINTNKK